MHSLEMYVLITANASLVAKNNILKYSLKLKCLYLVMLNIGTRWQSLLFYCDISFKLNLSLN